MVSDTADRTETDEGDRRRRALLALLALAAVIALIVWWFLARTVTVPDVTGLTHEQAQERLVAAGLSTGEVTTVTSTLKETPGTVVQQTPAAGGLLPRGARVALALAKALDEGGGPDAATSAGLIDDSYLDLAEEGRDIDNVGLVPDSPPVQTGPRVPMALNKNASDARTVLSSAGYGVKVAYGASTTTMAPGIVYKQDPAPGACEPRGTLVTIWVSTGPPK